MDCSSQIERFMRLVTEFNKFNEESHIPNPDKGSIAVMTKLYFSKEMYSCQLAKELHLSRARLSSIVKGLKTKKYITCRYHLTDKRKILIKITQSGAKIVKDTYDKAIDKIRKYLYEMPSLYDVEEVKIYLDMKMKKISIEEYRKKLGFDE